MVAPGVLHDAAEIAAVIHPFARLTSNYAFAQRGLDRFGRAPGAPVTRTATDAAGSGFQAAADDLIAVPGKNPVGGGGPGEMRPSIGPPATESVETAETAETPSAAERPLPHIPRYADVPADLQWPDGPYRQAPPEYGGEWWQVSPFTGEQPWLQLDHVSRTAEAVEETPLAMPEGFLKLFGPEPAGRNQVERIRWEQDLEHFKQAGVPEGFSAEQIEAASSLFESWGLGRPQFYEGRYGWSARFPDSAIPDFEANPHTAIEAAHLVVARYQIRLAQQGEAPAERHPFVPPQVFGDSPLDA